MLSLRTVTPNTLELLKALMSAIEDKNNELYTNKAYFCAV